MKPCWTICFLKTKPEEDVAVQMLLCGRATRVCAWLMWLHSIQGVMSCAEAMFTLMAAILTAWDALASLITVHTPVMPISAFYLAVMGGQERA